MNCTCLVLSCQTVTTTASTKLTNRTVRPSSVPQLSFNALISSNAFMRAIIVMVSAIVRTAPMRRDVHRCLQINAMSRSSFNVRPPGSVFPSLGIGMCYSKLICL